MTRHQIKPLLQSFEGWNQDTSQLTSPADLPSKMTEYVAFINKFVGAAVSHISVGPGRDQIVTV
jgi:adenylosuccinate synthase